MLLLAPMKKLCLMVLASLMLVLPAKAMDNALRAGLMKLDPETRLEQRCDAEVLDRISHDDHNYKADRVVAYAFATPQMSADAIKSSGAAFRSKGQWYRLKFKCQTAPDHMQVLQFRYRIGDEIPESDWSKYNLYD
ncbi:DUF930 domain-containing protein [Mesorhizobium sp. CA8]|uniref:DUF930 domain-containing protein n=1 Tax=unclassified Mesorhizobium TaxID=325217 RepID=UPI001CC9F30F|nr:MULTISPECIES: DUF930 domain-containing protein [unclassified Mesorhizobium]MBZ9759640.1 DUF930 domain-containing protein [Mesorhizobium sp. CA8]MBZ9821714.1 DUF930 domain-containing protein [Mesorhizobium sp. CA4]